MTILGSSSALPKPDRFTTAHVLNVHERFFLIDCGEGTQIQLRKYRIRFGRLNHIFISHLHGDHFFGLFGLLSSLNLIGRKTPLFLYGPAKLKMILDAVYGNMGEQLLYQVNFRALDTESPEIILDNDKITVSSFPLQHKIPANGFVFREKPRLRNLHKPAIDEFKLELKEIVKLKNGQDVIRKNGDVLSFEELTSRSYIPRSYAFVSDTRFDEHIADLVKGVDLLYHEATYLDDMKLRAQMTGHSTALEAGRIAKIAEVKKLVIGHFSARYKDVTPLVREAQSVFSNTVGAVDGLKIDVEKS
ncbi:MAG: ribonuclease Z [Bacteroidales bacterium]|nr:ribonuclease Z [Bacteroidales bacterium]